MVPQAQLRAGHHPVTIHSPQTVQRGVHAPRALSHSPPWPGFGLQARALPVSRLVNSEGSRCRQRS